MTQRILFCGLGSIGRRHARLMKDNFEHSMFAFRTSKGQEMNDLGISEIYSWNDVKNGQFDVAFISNPTYLHIDTAMKCAEMGMALFIEKPIDSDINGLDELLTKVAAKNVTTYVAYPLRFHPVVIALKDMLEGKKVLHARLVCASYLPDWRAGQDHLKSYSASKAMGGGVLMDLSHELDYASYLFGDISCIEGRCGRIGDVTLDSDDYADLLVRHSDLPTSIHLNYFSRTPQRSIEIDTEDEHLTADLIDNCIKCVGIDGTWNKHFELKKDEMYLSQLKYFFDNIENKRMSNNLFDASAMFRKMMYFKDSV